MIVIDSDGMIVMSNNSADALFGYTHKEMLQMNVDMLLPERLRMAHARHRYQYFLAPLGRQMGTGLQLYGLRKDHTEFSVDISLRPFVLEGETHSIAAIRDTTPISSLAARVDQLNKLIQERTITPILSLVNRVNEVETRMDLYEGKMNDMQIKITEVSDATKANHIMLQDIQDNMKTLTAINTGIESIKKLLMNAFLWFIGIIGGAASIAIATLIINHFSHP